MGYHRAGFDVVGVDNKPQPHYPFEFHQADALEFCEAHGHEFDAIHASPPCQAFSASQVIRGRDHPDLLTPCRLLMQASGRPWVIENVVKAPMRTDAMLCGSMFGLQVQRHRLFEWSEGTPILAPACHHVWRHGRPVGVYGHTGGKSTGLTSGNHGWLVADWREAMGIDWMMRDELAQAIPPAYTEYIGGFLIDHLNLPA